MNKNSFIKIASLFIVLCGLGLIGVGIHSYLNQAANIYKSASWFLYGIAYMLFGYLIFSGRIWKSK